MKKLFSIALLLSSAAVVASATTGNNGLPDGSKCRFNTDCATGLCTNVLSGGEMGGSYCASITSGEGGSGGPAVPGQGGAGVQKNNMGEPCTSDSECYGGTWCSQKMNLTGKNKGNYSKHYTCNPSGQGLHVKTSASGEGGSGGPSQPVIGKLLPGGAPCVADRQCANGTCLLATTSPEGECNYATGYKPVPSSQPLIGPDGKQHLIGPDGKQHLVGLGGIRPLIGLGGMRYLIGPHGTQLVPSELAQLTKIINSKWAQLVKAKGAVPTQSSVISWLKSSKLKPSERKIVANKLISYWKQFSNEIGRGGSGTLKPNQGGSTPQSGSNRDGRGGSGTLRPVNPSTAPSGSSTAPSGSSTGATGLDKWDGGVY